MNVIKVLAQLCIVFCAATFFRALAAEGDVAPGIKKYAEYSAKFRPKEIARLEHLCLESRKQLAAVKRARHESTEAKEKAVSRAQRKLDLLLKQLEDVEDPFKPFYAPRDPRDLNLGSVARVEWKMPMSEKYTGADHALVYQVIDGNNMLVELRWFVEGYEIHGELGEQVEIKKWDTKTSLIWVKGLPTSTLVPGDLPARNGNPDDVFEIKRSQTYATAAGGNSVLMLELMDMRPYEPFFTMADQKRVWTDASGKHSFEAIFVRLNKGKVRLVGMDRKARDVPMEKLSADDQEYVRDQMREIRRASSGNVR